MSKTLYPLDLKILSEGEIRWANGIWQKSIDVKELCASKQDVEEFIKDCEKNIRNPGNSKVEWNTEIYSFGGKDNSHTWLFSSKKDTVIKLALQIQHEANAIVVGHMKISTPKEKIKYLKHIGKPQVSSNRKDINISSDTSM